MTQADSVSTPESATEESPTSEPGPVRRTWASLRRPSSIALFLVMLLSGALMLVAIHRSPEISVYDEQTHADYAYQVSIGHVPAAGDTIAPEILNEWSCRRPAAGDGAVPPCDSGAPAGAYPTGGAQYNIAHPPLYFAITAGLVKILELVRSGPTDFIGNARITGVLWMWAGMFVMFLALRRFGMGEWWAVAGAASIPLVPGFAVSATIVTNDAPAALAGAAALWCLARIVKDRNYGWLLPALAAGLVTATKIMSALPFIGLGVFCLLFAYSRWRAKDAKAARKLVIAGVAMSLAIVLVYGVWTYFQAGRGVPDWRNPVLGVNTKPVSGSPFDEILSPAFSAFWYPAGPLHGFGFNRHFTNPIYGVWLRLLGYVVMAAPLMIMAMSRRGSMGRILGGITLGLELFYPHIVEIVTVVGSNDYFPRVAKRYAISIVPLLIGCLIFVAYRRGAYKTLLAFGAFGAVATGLTLTGL